MNFASGHAKRRDRENIVPMINVVFLLLIFFLMTAQIAPQPPFDITPPDSLATEDPAPDTLYIGPDGQVSYEGLLDEAALASLRTRTADEPLSLRADATFDARAFAALLSKLAEAGVRETVLITGER
jgi:biopolymer transport protein ExbD